MDLGLNGRSAFVAASSQGLGLACAASLLREGVDATLNGRDADKLQAAASGLAAEFPERRVGFVVADLTTEEGIASILARVPRVDILVTNNAGPAPGTLEEWDVGALQGAFAANAIPAIQLIRHYVPGMRQRHFGRVVNITSAMVKTPRYEMGLSTAARTALTAISKAISVEVAGDNVTLNNLLPERIDTPRQEFMAARIMRQRGVSREEARAQITQTVAARRFGSPREFGDTCAFLCSEQAGFISGQNVQVDGGSYRGLV